MKLRTLACLVGFLVLAPFVLGQEDSGVDWEVFGSGSADQVRAEIAKLPKDSGLGTARDSALLYAAMFNTSPEVITVLLEAGAELEARTEGGWTPLGAAAGMPYLRRSPEVITVLLEAGAELEARDKYGRTPFMGAADHNTSPEVITTLLEAGAELEARTENGRTPLMYAAWGTNPEVITLLLEAGADVNARDGRGLTPLLTAALLNHSPEVIAALLEAGADAKAKDQDGKTALDYAKGNEKIYRTKAYWELNDAIYK